MAAQLESATTAMAPSISTTSLTPATCFAGAAA